MTLITYNVRAGDNLSNIAKSFNSTVKALQDFNAINNPDRIYIGQVLMIPDSVASSDLTIRIVDNDVRIRRKPEFADNIITLLAKGVMFSKASSNGDWWQVEYQGENAYIHASMVETVVPVPVPDLDLFAQAEAVNTVVYRSQWDVDANNRTSDCGQTCVAMLAGSQGVNVKINDLPYQSDPRGYSSSTHLVNNFNHVQLTARTVNVPLASQAPNNSICLVWYNGFRRDSVQDKKFTGWHWVVFLREDANGVIVHDPDFWGNRRDEGSEKRYSFAEWNAAFIPYASGSARTCVELV